MSSEITTENVTGGATRTDVAARNVSARPRERSEPRRVTVIGAPSVNIFSNLAKLWRYRDLLYTLTLHRISVRYKQSALGVAWAVLQPLALMLIYTAIFSLIARMPSDGAPYALFAYTALLPWTFFANALTTSTNALVSHAQIITKVYFPREILPVTYVIAAVFDFLIASFLLLGMMLYYRIALTWNLIYVLPIMLALFCFATAGALFFSAWQVRFRDIGMAMPLLLQLWMFATPVVYPLSAIERAPKLLRSLYMLNPMVGLVENFRQVVLRGVAPDMRLLVTAALVSILLLAAAYMNFKRVEATVADVV